ncbi:uncharacterized protein B0I36DRAFT_310742 [Microdochium trichocladiopsis]|uniref:Uncharacterized protein n=1 Tax=Microdochium trichocladiopsis TaxID=1682393 RepID=A0A9P8YK27_9PEZI|nr:uncharacterized protein B0I36DRAFT_310742 [Microdochium trichocladiopsis]KAH7040465.1 hypothetical protein B0I36DRAFT_310742 [Microdochium trichocladiopsis]
MRPGERLPPCQLDKSVPSRLQPLHQETQTLDVGGRCALNHHPPGPRRIHSVSLAAQSERRVQEHAVPLTVSPEDDAPTWTLSLHHLLQASIFILVSPLPSSHPLVLAVHPAFTVVVYVPASSQRETHTHTPLLTIPIQPPTRFSLNTAPRRRQPSS